MLITFPDGYHHFAKPLRGFQEPLQTIYQSAIKVSGALLKPPDTGHNFTMALWARRHIVSCVLPLYGTFKPITAVIITVIMVVSSV